MSTYYQSGLLNYAFWINQNNIQNTNLKKSQAYNFLIHLLCDML